MTSKESVNYTTGTPPRICINCSMYGNESCSAVAGHISPEGYCDLYDQVLQQDTVAADGAPFPETGENRPTGRTYAAGPAKGCVGVAVLNTKTGKVVGCFPTASKARAKARTLNQEDQSLNEPTTFAPVLTLEELGGPVILQEPRSDGGKYVPMRARMPFYVANSVSKAPGFKQKVYFSAETLDKVIEAGNRQIAERKQPLTFYPRHNNALAGDRLPAGKWVQLEREGRVGYAVLELNNTTDGKDTQEAIRAGDLNAVSLRAGAGRFEMEQKKINGEPMLDVVRLELDGIDGAPDSPAMPTYGVEVLAAEARIEPIPTRSTSMSEMTAEGLRAENPQLVSEIEASVRKEYEALVAERDALLAEKKKGERDAIITELANKFPDPAAAQPILEEICAGATTKEEALAMSAPFLLETLSNLKATTPAEEVKPQPSLQERLNGLVIGGAGKALVTEEKPEFVGQMTVVGLGVPDN